MVTAHKFLPVIRDNGTQTVTTPLNYGIFSALRGSEERAWVRCIVGPRICHGERIAWYGSREGAGIPVLVRADMWLRDRPRSGPKLLLKTAFLSVVEEHGGWGSCPSER